MTLSIDWNRLGTGISHWFEPSPLLTTDARRRRARLLAIMIVPFFFNSLAGALFTPQPVSTSLWILSALLLLAFFLSRTRYAQIAALLTVVGYTLPSFVAVIALPQYTTQAVWTAMPWMVIPIFLGSIWLPVSLLLWVTVLVCGFMTAMPLILEGLTYSHMKGPLVLCLTTFGLAIIGSALTQRDQRSIEDQSLQYQRSQLLLATVLDNIQEAVIVFDLDGMIKSMNQAAAKLLATEGIDHHALHASQFCSDIVTHMELTTPRDNKLTDTRDYLLHNHVCHRQNGDSFKADLVLKRITVAKENFFLLILRDLTEKLQLDTMKNDFVASVSHELRTPLTSIEGALALLNSLHKGQMEEQASKLLNIAQRNSQLLTELINDILDLSRLEGGHMLFHKESFDLCTLVRGTLEENQPLAAGAQVNIELRSPAFPIVISADPIRLRQVINNLLSNAIKFSPKHNNVIVTIDKANNSARISVQDFGPGVPEHFKDRIFTKFTRADTRDNRNIYGTGLGLSISKEIVRQMGGKIDFVSSPEQGTLFFFEIPLQTTIQSNTNLGM